MSGPAKGGITRKVLMGRSASGLIKYEGELEAGKEAPLFSTARNCSSEIQTQIVEWQATRLAHGTDGAKRAAKGSFESVDPETGLHANGQPGTHVKYFDGKRKQTRPVRAGEIPTHLYVPPESLMQKESEAVHTIYAAGADLVNPENIEDCARFFLAVKSERETLYPGLQEKLWLERNGKSGLVHVHVASNATIYKDFTLAGVDYRAGQKMAGELTKVDDVRERSDAFLDAHPEFGFSQNLARVGTQEYTGAQKRDGQKSYRDEKERGQESNQDQVRRKVYEALVDDDVTDHDTFIAKMAELDVEVKETGLRRGKPGKNHDLTYIVDGAKQGVRGTTLGVEFTYTAIGTQLDLKALGREIKDPAGKQKTGEAKPLPFEQQPLSVEEQIAHEQMVSDVKELARQEREARAARLVEQGPEAIGKDVVEDLSRRHSAWSSMDVLNAVDRRLAPVRITGAGFDRDFEEMRNATMDSAEAELISVLDRDVIDDDGVIKHWTTQRVIDTEKTITDSLSARARYDGHDGDVKVDRGGFMLTDEQSLAAKAITGDHKLVVIEGAAGSGKTVLLDAANEQVKKNDRRLVVVSPTKRGALEAGSAIGAEGNSVHSMLYRAGAKINKEDGHWVLPNRWDNQPEQFQMDENTVLVVDEVGMMDKETAAVLHRYVDDENLGTLVLTGDTKQLSAVGRGGYLARAGASSDNHIDLRAVRRFKTADGQIDQTYADASVALRGREDTGAFFDMLSKRGQVQTGEHHEIVARVAQSVALELNAGNESIAIASTNATAQQVNHAVYEQLAAAGALDISVEAQGRAGDPIAAGAKVATRKNDHNLDVANRQTFIVNEVSADGSVTVMNPETAELHELPAAYVSENLQLAYAVTAHGGQGMTADTAHTILNDRMDAAGAYVGLTRGRNGNVLHVAADDNADARQQFESALRRDNADQGLDVARQDAERELGTRSADFDHRVSESTSEPSQQSVAKESTPALDQQLEADEPLKGKTFDEMLAEVQARVDGETHPVHADQPSSPVVASKQTGQQPADVPSATETPAQESALEDVDQQPVFRSQLHRLKANTPARQKRVDALAELEDRMGGIAPTEADDRAACAKNIAGIGLRRPVLNVVSPHLQPEIRDQLELYVDKREYRGETKDAQEKNRTAQERVEARNRLDETDKLSTLKGDGKVLSKRVDRLDDELKRGVFEKDTPGARAEHEARKQQVIRRGEAVRETGADKSSLEDARDEMRAIDHDADSQSKTHDQGYGM